MRRLAQWILQHRWFVLIGTLLITVWLGYRAFQLQVNADFSTYLRQESELTRSYDHVGEAFGGKSTSFLILQSDRPLDAQVLGLVAQLTRTLQASEDVSYVTSLTNVLDFKSTEWGLEVGTLLPREPAEMSPQELDSFWKYLLSKKRYRGALVSEDLTSTVLVVRLKPSTDEFRFSRWLQQVSDQTIRSFPHLTATVKAYSGGMPALMFSMTTLITRNLTVLMPIMVGLILLTLILGFRRPGGVLMPLTDVIVSTIWAMGFVQLLGYQVNLLVGIMPVILLAMGSADGIHIMKGYYEHRYRGQMPKEAMIETLAELGTPVLITSLTTSVGFATLAVSSFSAIRQFGIATAISILVALVVTILIIPTLVSFAPETPIARSTHTRHRWALASRAAALIIRHPGKIIAGGGLLLFGSVALLPLIRTDVDWSLCLAKGSDPYHAEMILRERYGGSLPLQVLFRGDLRDPATLQQMFLTENYLESLDLVHQSLSIAGVLAEMNEVLTGQYAIPETREGVNNLWLLLEGEDLLEQLVAEDESEALLQARLGTMHTQKLVRVVDAIDTYIERFPGTPLSLALDEKTRPAWLDQVTRLLIWNVQERGADVDEERVREVVEGGVTTPLSLQSVLLTGIQDYLLSPEAEVEFSSERRATSLAEAVAELATNAPEPPHLEGLERLLTEGRWGLTPEDAGFLAPSLEQTIRTIRGNMRNDMMLRRLRQVIPDPLWEDPGFVKEVRGALWLLNQDRVFLLDSGGKPALTAIHTGLAPILKQMEEELTPTQVESVLLALFLISLLFALIFRSWRIGVLGVVPLVLTILLNFSVMSLLGIGLDSFTAMIASLAVGLGVDYAVHFTSRFQRETARYKNPERALEETLRTTGRAIVINALAVGLGFSVLLFAGGQHIRRFGGLTALTMFTAAFLTLTLLPAVYFRLKPGFIRSPARKSESNA